MLRGTKCFLLFLECSRILCQINFHVHAIRNVLIYVKNCWLIQWLNFIGHDELKLIWSLNENGCVTLSVNSFQLNQLFVLHESGNTFYRSGQQDEPYSLWTAINWVSNSTSKLFRSYYDCSMFKVHLIEAHLYFQWKLDRVLIERENVASLT